MKFKFYTCQLSEINFILAKSIKIYWIYSVFFYQVFKSKKKYHTNSVHLQETKFSIDLHSWIVLIRIALNKTSWNYSGPLGCHLETPYSWKEIRLNLKIAFQVKFNGTKRWNVIVAIYAYHYHRYHKLLLEIIIILKPTKLSLVFR